MRRLLLTFAVLAALPVVAVVGVLLLVAQFPQGPRPVDEFDVWGDW